MITAEEVGAAVEAAMLKTFEENTPVRYDEAGIALLRNAITATFNSMADKDAQWMAEQQRRADEFAERMFLGDIAGAMAMLEPPA